MNAKPADLKRAGLKLSDRVATLLESRILDGEYQPGEKLPTEPELERLLDVSRSVVRDALRTLSARGLVEIRQGRGVTVTKPGDYAYGDAMALLLRRSDLTMGDVLEARQALETSLAPLIATGLMMAYAPETWPISVYMIILALVTLVSVYFAAETRQGPGSSG